MDRLTDPVRFKSLDHALVLYLEGAISGVETVFGGIFPVIAVR